MEERKDLISRDFIKSLGGECIAARDSKTHELLPISSIDALPSAQPERPNGEWILSGENTYTCSVCGKTIITNKDYIKEHKWCFGCGTKMDKRKGADE